jgi:trigger factor
MVELGSEGLIAEFDAALTGASAGDERNFDVTFPDDHRPEDLAGKTATFAVTVKEVREKDLPELDDEFASEASEFDTLDELREHLRERIGEALARRSEDEFREAAVDAAAAAATIEVPHDLVHARAHEMWDRIERSLQARGVSPQAYAQMQGKTREELVTEAEADAERALRREATLAAVADAEEIEVSDDELLEALGPGEGKNAPEKLLERLRDAGRDNLLRDEVRLRKAAELITESAAPIPLDQAAARERLWTPEKEPAEAAEAGAGGEPEAKPGELWTPGRDD